MSDPEFEEDCGEEFDPHAERSKSESTVEFAIIEEICGTMIVLSVIICITVLIYHWS